VGGALRFTALGWGLRHTPHIDERYFVENVSAMLASGDLDHRFYEYPGLFFYLLYPVFAALEPGSRTGATGYLAARALVAAFGTLNIGLAFLVARRWLGKTAALTAAAFLAVSTADVETAHMVRPDVVLQTFVLLGLIAMRGVGSSIRGDVLCGLAIGAGAAVKFTGALVVPAYVLQRALTPGPRVKGVFLAGLTAVAVFCLATPYALIHWDLFRGDATAQVLYHYARPTEAFAIAKAFAYVWPQALGWAGVSLALGGLGVVALRHEWRAWAGPLALPLVTLAVFGTTSARATRQMVPSLAVLVLLIGLFTAEARRRLGIVAAGLISGLALMPPLWASVAYVQNLATPGTRDRVVGWLGANVAVGSVVATTLEDLGIDEGRFVALRIKRATRYYWPQIVAADVLVSHPEAEGPVISDLPLLYEAQPQNRFSGPPLTVRAIPDRLRPRFERLSLEGVRLAASTGAAQAGKMVDGRTETAWQSARPQRRGDWVEVALREDAVIGRIELDLGTRARAAAKAVTVWASDDGESWRPVHAFWGPSSSPLIQLIVLDPVRTRHLRLILDASSGSRWWIAELRLDRVAVPAAPVTPATGSEPGVAKPTQNLSPTGP
jgi:4-amino-4-deoxy-L-arabinose transferase-like glycosyltransferase